MTPPNEGEQVMSTTSPAMSTDSTETTGFVKIDGKDVYYRIKGEGPPMVFVHGWSLNLSYWNAQVEYFSKNYRTYSYDWLGMGKSGGGKKAFSMHDLSDQLGGLIDKFSIRKPIIVGHSEGGGIVLNYVTDNPTGFSKLVLADTALNSLRDHLVENISAMFMGVFSHVEKYEGKNPLIDLAPAFEKQFYSPGFIEKNPEFIAAWNAQFISNNPDVLVNGLRAWAWRQNHVRQLKKVKVPTLLLWGNLDTVITLAQMQNIQSDISTSQLVQLDGSGHMTPVEVPDAFNAAMNSFLG
jgi:pimeloyl-ACP methyl ester carboxylesterase